jgi:PadR family transcriptional regulator PadR
MNKEKTDVLHGSLAFMVLRTLETLGPQHGWGIARRIEQISGDVLELNQGTLYPALLRLQQTEAENWERVSAIMARFMRPAGESS